jgi:signal transduction histidine kinase
MIENARRLSRDLSPSILEDIGLTPALRWLVDSFVKNYQIPVALDIVDLDSLFPRDSQILIYRVFQEALANIGKHARAARVSAEVRREGRTVSFVIEDDGRGFDLRSARAREDPEKGLGLATMDERARMLGGSLEIESAVGKGTRVTLFIPLGRGDP